MKTYSLVMFAGAFIVSGSQLGCGGGSGSSCGKVYPCGGNIVGSWKMTEGCFVDSSGEPPDFCPTATVRASGVKVTGSVTYTADLKYSVTGTIGGSLEMVFPNSCLTFGTSTITCAQFEEAQKAAQAQLPEPVFQSIACAPKGATCTCNIVTVTNDISEAGTYDTDGTTVTETATGEAPQESGYCVQGNQLHRTELDMTMPMGSMGRFKISNDIVLVRQ